MKRILVWILIIFACLGAIGIVIFTLGKINPFQGSLQKEIKLIKATAAAEKLGEQVGYKEAVIAIEREYAKELSALDEKEKKIADILRNDPVALTRFLINAGAKKNI